jgi:hypothetical protein
MNMKYKILNIKHSYKLCAYVTDILTKSVTFVVFILIFSCFFACKNEPSAAEQQESELTICVPFDEKHTLSFLGTTDAQAAVVLDSMTTYFDHITSLDMAIQMQDTDLQYLERDSLMPIYKWFLQQHVQHFSAAERNLIVQYQRAVSVFTQKIHPNLLPKDLRFIKTDGKIYGEQTCFTRHNCIFLPKKLLENALKGDTARFKNTLAHEVFHIISRYKPRLAQQLYLRIGFDTIQHLRLPDSLLAARILGNPDGANPYRIRLSDSITGTMLSLASSTDFDDSEPFEAHLNWDMYAVEKRAGEWCVKSDSLGESTLSNTWEVPFYKKTTTNTAYTLHPDEILAENFVLLFRSKTEPTPLAIETAGRVLLYDINRILKQK